MQKVFPLTQRLATVHRDRRQL